MKVIYVFDALCGWCYGFAPVISELHREYRRQLPFEVVSGGLMRGERSGPIGEVAAYISDAFKKVEQKTGVAFGDDFLEVLDEGSTVFDSLPPARAMAVFREMKPESAVLYAEDIQNAIYHDGVKPTNLLPYVDLAAKYDVSPREFKQKLQSEDSLKAAEADFARTVELGATGYPTVYFEFEGQRHLIARGYTAFNVLQARFDHVVSRAKRAEEP